MAINTQDAPVGTTEPSGNLIWCGRLSDGAAIEGRAEAIGKRELRVRLARRGIYPLSIARRRRFKPRIDNATLATALTQLAKLVGASVPLTDALAAVARSHRGSKASKNLADAFGRVRQIVENGSSLATGLNDTGITDRFGAELIAIGEATGRLNEVLTALARRLSVRQQNAKSLQKALAYPLTVLTIAILVTIVMMVEIVPQFAEIYQQFGADLPAVTAFVVGVSDNLRHGLPYLIVVGALAGGGILAARRVDWTMPDAIHDVLLMLPIIGNLKRAGQLADAVRALLIAIESGMPLVDALNLARSTSRGRLRRELGTITALVREGGSMTEAMESLGTFPPIVTTMVAAGETAGDLATMLRHVADQYDELRERATAILTALAEPLVMVVLGGLVGGILIALYLPIFGLGNALGGS